MSSCSGSVSSFHDEDEDTLLDEKLDIDHLNDGIITDNAIFYPTSISKPWWPFSGRPTTKLMRKLVRLLITLLPSFVVRDFSRSNKEIRGETLLDTAFLDGMRGFAAFAVFLCHLTYSTFDINHTWAAGEEDQRHTRKSFLRLPILRLLYSGPPMVAIFFVISGYALSYKPLKQMHDRDYEGLMLTLTSSVFRRALRLFLPCFASTFIIVFLTQLGLYQITDDFANNTRAVHEAHYRRTSTLSSQLSDWFCKLLGMVDAFDWNLYAGATDLDPHLWTIPVEFRCSLALFLTHILTSRMSSQSRLSIVCFLLCWGTCWNRWDMGPFWAGMLLAELDLIKKSKQRRPPTLNLEKSDNRTDARSTWYTWVYLGLLLSGLYLASYPDLDGHLSPGYIYLTNLIPTCYTEKHRFWGNIGAVMIVWSVSNLPCVKGVFESNFAQYFGKISFPLYICHGFVIHTFTYASWNWIWTKTGGYDDWSTFVRGFMFVALCTMLITTWVSDIFLRFIDIRCVRFSKWLEKLLCTDQNA